MVISVANTKGGCGKSSITVFLASALVNEGKKVLVLDCDSQETISNIYNLDTKLYGTPSVDVEAMPPRYVQKYLQMNADNYDIIFLDIPRFTKGAKDTPSTMLLYYCDMVLIPSLGSIVDVLSTMDFIPIINEMKTWKVKNDLDFQCYGFINRFNSRSDNKEAANKLKEEGLKMFSNNLNDLKVFTTPSLFNSLMESKEGLRRFGGFYNEFKSKL